MSQKTTCLSALLAAVILAGIPASLYANITNKGSDAVQIEIERSSGFSQNSTIYPGQKIELPENATSVKVVKHSFARGDENIMIAVVEKDGETYMLEQYGAVHVLNKSEDDAEAPVILREGKVSNDGNIGVLLEITDSSGRMDQRSLYNNQTLMLPKTTKKVRVTSNYPLRGDENISVNVLMPDGETSTITRLGGIARIIEE